MRFCNPSDVRALVQTKIKGGMVDQLLASIFSGKSKTAEKTSYEKRASSDQADCSGILLFSRNKDG